MKANKPIILIFLLIIAVLAIGCAREKPQQIERPAEAEKAGPAAEEATGKVAESVFSISQRNFYIGIVPTPKTLPESTFTDMLDAFKEAGDLGEVTMAWPEKTGIGLYDSLKKSRIITGTKVYGLKPVVTLTFATLKEIPGEGIKYVVNAPEGVEADLSDPEFRRLWVEEAEKIADKFEPGYFSLGNEINDYFYLYPDQLEDYLTLFDEAYTAIKQVSPDTKVFVVFSYTHMIDNEQEDMMTRFDERADLIGLTTYPWKHFDEPDDIPQDYYTRLEQFTEKPIAFTEIGWVSSKSAGSSEEEQADFLVRFVDLTKDVDVEMVNWLFLHEVELTGLVGKVTKKDTSSIALKKADGTKKKVYGVWEELKKIECDKQ